MNGWIKLHRELIGKPIFENEKLLKVWVWCLMKATHTEREQPVGRQIQKLIPGQFITGRHKAGEELSMPPSSAWAYMNMLKDNGSLDIKSNNKYSVVTIENWSFYQDPGDLSDNNPDNKWTTNGQQMDTNKNVKNVKNDKNLKDIKDMGEKRKRFIPPTKEEVELYCLERNNRIDPEKFIDFYASKNWMVGKNKMTDWKASVRTWEKNNQPTKLDKTENPHKTKFHLPESRGKDYNNDDLEKILRERREENIKRRAERQAKQGGAQ